MGNCKDCKWWASADDWASGNSKFHRRCTVVPVLDECDPSEHLAVATGYDNSGILLTNPDFGCVQFEAK